MEETKKETVQFPSVNPWDVLIWKLDSLEKYIQREVGDLRREIGDVRREIAELRQEVRDEIAELRQEVRNEIRGTRRSFTILEWTAVLGFAAIVAAIMIAKFL